MLPLSRMLVGSALVAGLVLAGLYTALRPEANPGTVSAVVSAGVEPPAAAAPARPAVPLDVPLAEPLPVATVEAAKAARGSAMAKLVFSEPRPVPTTVFTDPSGAEHRLEDWRGKWLVVNFWAVWCVPCRVEMPALDALEKTLGGEDFAVVTIATGRNPLPALDRFLDETGVTALPRLLDPKMALSREMGVLGLPVSIIIDPEGREVARLIGEADWNAPEAHAVLTTLIGR